MVNVDLNEDLKCQIDLELYDDLGYALGYSLNGLLCDCFGKR
jgi:hypothetical protein